MITTSESQSPRPLVRNKLRIGLLIDSFFQPGWLEKVISDIQSSSVAQIVLIIKNGTPPTPKKPKVQSYWQNRAHLLFAAYSRFDNFKTDARPDAFATVNIEPLVHDCPVITVQPLSTKFTDRFPDEAVQAIREYELDVAIRLGFGILKGDVLKIARHGVWSYHHGDNTVNRGGPAGFWEVMHGTPITGAMLQVLTEELDNGKVLCRSLSPTSDKFSVKLNRNNYYWKSSALVMRKLRELQATGQLEFEQNSFYHAYSDRLFKRPTNSEMIRLLARLTARYCASKARHFSSFEQWCLAYRFRTTSDDTNNAFYKFKYLVPPKDRFWADPFPVKVGNRYFIFIEEFIYADGKGHISVIEIDRQRSTPPVKVLACDYHLSYPFVFEWENNFYMIPEASAKGGVDLYRSISFPHEWKLEKTLVPDVNATDATVFEKDGVWWMFVNIGEMKFPTDWDELHIYHATNLTGEWRPHKLNPVKTDVRSSRPAGRIFTWNGDLYRPAQDSSERYGYAISINRILLLTTDDYAEQEVSRILPRWNKDIVGTHTLNTAEDLTVIDCLMRRSRFS